MDEIPDAWVDPEAYDATVLRRFHAPDNAGIPAGAGLVGAAASQTRGARVALYLRVEGACVADAGFEALGCPHLIAAADAVADDLRGRRIDELSAYRAGLLDALLPAEKLDLKILLEDAVRDAAHRAAGGEES